MCFYNLESSLAIPVLIYSVDKTWSGKEKQNKKKKSKRKIEKACTTEMLEHINTDSKTKTSIFFMKPGYVVTELNIAICRTVLCDVLIAMLFTCIQL